MYVNVFIVNMNVFECIYCIFMVYVNAFIVCFNVFHCISMCLNVDIVIEILPSHSHCNVFTMHTHLHIFFSLYTMTSFPTCYTTTLLFFPFPLIRSNFHKIYKKITYQSLLHIYTSPHIPCSTFHIPCRHWLCGA
jgi:hypothetical protein